MPGVCVECGDALNQESSCQEIFKTFLALEFSDPAYGEVHMLTVACFMIQHGRYSDTALVWMEQQLRNHLEGGMPPEQIRQNTARETAHAQRSWNILRSPGDPKPPQVDWSMHISDVAAAYHDPASYCALIRKWAQVTLAEMRLLLSRRP